MGFDSIETYRLDAMARAKNRTALRILNDSEAHANVLIDTMIGVAQCSDVVRIYSGELPESLYKDALFATKARKITVVLEESATAATGKDAWLSALPQDTLDKMSIYKINRPRANHFFCVSSGAFRYEIDHKTSKVEANFNEPTTVLKLENAFDGYVKDSVPITTPSSTIAKVAV